MKNVGRVRAILSAGLVFWAAFAGMPAAEEPGGEKAVERFRHLYILSFDQWGVLTNPAELDFAVEELRNDPSIERILILSYGWNNDGRESYSAYRTLVDEMQRNFNPDVPRRNLAVIAVGWDSSQTAIRKLTGDLMPLPAIGEAIAWLPDKLLTGFSFWSKAAYADRIGYGGLRTALNELFSIYDKPEDHPEILLMGHSFGTRVIAALLFDDEKKGNAGFEPFESVEHIVGAALIQPALVSRNIDKNAPYPLLVTMSRHDRAIGFLYPIANLPINTYSLTANEAFIQRRIYDRIEQHIEKTASTVTNLLPANADEDGAEKDAERPLRARPTRDRSRRIFGETLSLPVTFVFSIIAAPIGYVYTQGYGLATHPLNHIMDSLAQIPLVEIPVDGLSRALRREVPWGQRSKGVFTLGGFNEGMGRMVPPALAGGQVPVYSLSEISQMEKPPNGVFVVDASDIIKIGALGLDQSRPLVDYTLGWIDPMGAHSSFKNPEVMALLSWFANSTPYDAP